MFPNGIAIIYLIAVVAFFIYLLRVFLGDATTPNTDKASWRALLLASLLWPLTMPFVLRKKLSSKRHRNAQRRSQLSVTTKLEFPI